MWNIGNEEEIGVYGASITYDVGDEELRTIVRAFKDIPLYSRHSIVSRLYETNIDIFTGYGSSKADKRPDNCTWTRVQLE